MTLLSLRSFSDPQVAPMDQVNRSATPDHWGEDAPQVTRHIVEFFKLLADETRLRILVLLQQEGELNVQSLCRTLEQTQPAVSHHLALLRVAGIVELRREGKHNFYRVLPQRFAEMLDTLRSFLPGEGPWAER